MPLQTINDQLKNISYIEHSRHRSMNGFMLNLLAGLVAMPAWGIPPKQGHHEALINKQTFKSIQERLAGNSYAPTRKDLSSDFPLRGAVCCADCETPFTSAWSKGRNKRSPYYLCYTKSCDSYGKSIKRADLEGAFEELLEQLQPMNEMFSVASKMFKTLWQTYGLNLQENKNNC